MNVPTFTTSNASAQRFGICSLQIKSSHHLVSEILRMQLCNRSFPIEFRFQGAVSNPRGTIVRHRGHRFRFVALSSSGTHDSEHEKPHEAGDSDDDPNDDARNSTRGQM